MIKPFTSGKKILKGVQSKGAMLEKEIIYFLYDYRNAANMIKLYYLCKID